MRGHPGWRRTFRGVVGKSLRTTEAVKGTRKILVLKPGVGRDDAARLARESGCRIVKKLPFINAVVVESPPGVSADVFTFMPEVEHVEEDGFVRLLCWRASRAPVQARQVMPWGVARIGAAEAWKMTRGAGIKVAVLDTGVDALHPDLKDSIGSSSTLLPGGGARTDHNGHGTHVAGTIAARDNDFGVVGVAPEAQVHSITVFDKAGRGRLSDIIEAMQLCVKNQFNVANMSFGTQQESRALGLAADKAAAEGVLLIAAAGNQGTPGSVHYPARYESVLAVAAVDSNDRLGSFSSRGPQVDIAGPGVDIFSTYKDGGYRKMSGTSMASPHVAGVAALAWSVDRTLSVEEVRRAVISSAEPLRGLGPEEQGAGLVSALKAVQLAARNAANRAAEDRMEGRE